jgi:hypothetical protein
MSSLAAAQANSLKTRKPGRGGSSRRPSFAVHFNISGNEDNLTQIRIQHLQSAGVTGQLARLISELAWEGGNG